MRWSIIRLIWVRELRDQLRDRRTLFMIAVLPVLLYPVAGIGLMQIAFGLLNQTKTISIFAYKNLPAAPPLPPVAWLSFTPASVGCPLAGVERFAGAVTLAHAAKQSQF